MNSDKGLRWWERALYIVFNWANNQFPLLGVDKKLKVKKFTPNLSKKNWKQLFIKNSPSRKLSNLFWMDLPWQAIKSELGEINVFETGCGDGRYTDKLAQWSGNKIFSYTGTDIERNENWEKLEKLNKKRSFLVADSKNVLKFIPRKTNLFVSQSAIEHFEEDLVYFEQIRDFVLKNNKPAIQIHLFPSAACLWLYLFHGVKQYTPRTISKITRLFNDFSYAVLYELGGRNCNRLHWEFITKSLLSRRIDRRDTETKEYDKRLIEAIKSDLVGLKREPSFYALVIHSNWKKKIFVESKDSEFL